MPNVTVRLGIQHFYYSKLKYDMLDISSEYAVAVKRFAIMDGSDEALRRGQAAGGDCVVSWDYQEWDYIVLDS